MARVDAIESPHVEGPITQLVPGTLFPYTALPLSKNSSVEPGSRVKVEQSARWMLGHSSTLAGRLVNVAATLAALRILWGV
jgi:hypothetical protein